LDSTRLDTLYSECVTKLSKSYQKTILLLDAGKTTDASSEFRTSFVSEVKKFYSESAETPPKRYLEDCNWNEKIRNLYIITQKTAGSLAAGDINSSRNYLEAIRVFFYKLNIDNKICLTGDAIYLFKMALDKVSSQTSLSAKDISYLNSVKSKIYTVSPSASIRSNKEQFSLDVKAWDEKVSRILSLPSVDASGIKQLKEITYPFYLKYGIDFE